MRRWFASVILTPIVLGLLTLIWGFAVDYTNLRAEFKIVKDEHTTIKKEVSDIHWYLIKKNGVKVPTRK